MVSWYKTLVQLESYVQLDLFARRLISTKFHDSAWLRDIQMSHVDIHKHQAAFECPD